ncbi:MAG: allantoicase [Myxococcota bacterium]
MVTDSLMFHGLIDLAAEAMGGRAITCSDDFFAGKDNLLKPGRGVFLPDEYTERGKWMDGWESRRRRSPGFDSCLIELGVPGVIRAVDIDTNHFLGNHPPYASLDGSADGETFRQVLEEVPLRPGSQNLFCVQTQDPLTHVRLNIFPDGGVARLRIYGEPHPAWKPSSNPEVAARAPGAVDLGAVRNGARAVACSDMFFGSMNNLIAPGRAANMGGGWETRRRRGPGHDWIVVRLGARGTVDLVEVDTNHFKGNYPDRCSLEGIDAADLPLTKLVESAEFQPLLPEQKLGPSARHFYADELAQPGPLTHVRLRIFPDGGISRLRLYGTREE